MQTNQPNPGQPRQINLQQMAEQFMAGLQRHFDMLAFNLASREAVKEEAYTTRVKAAGGMPASQVHANFEQMQAYARDLLLRQVVNDSVNLAVACLHNVHFFLAIIKANAEHGTLSAEAQQKAQQAQQEFLQAPLDQKFDRLERDYGVMCELEDTITSLGFALQALMQQGGVLKEQQVDDEKTLKLELKAPKGDEPGLDAWRKPDGFETVEKILREGEQVKFSDEELQSLLNTIAIYAHQLFTAVSNYARENQPGTQG